MELQRGHEFPLLTDRIQHKIQRKVMIALCFCAVHTESATFVAGLFARRVIHNCIEVCEKSAVLELAGQEQHNGAHVG
jgi:hypothetical protein